MEESPDETRLREELQAVYREELRKADTIRQVNRHRSCPPYEWFGPDPEPTPAGEGCGCAGCEARLKYGS